MTKKWLWSEKKISVSSGSLCPSMMMMSHPRLPKDGEGRLRQRGARGVRERECACVCVCMEGEEGAGGLATLDPRLQDTRGSGGGKRQPKQTS